MSGGAPGPVSFPLSGTVLRQGAGGPSMEHAARLLGSLGARIERVEAMRGLIWEADPERLDVVGPPPTQRGGGWFPGCDSKSDAATDWAGSGAMWLTGMPKGPPLVAPAPVASAARGAALAIEALTAVHPCLERVEVDGAQLLGERAALSGLRRRGPMSPGGSCRLLPAADALLAVNLPRHSDLELIAAWLEVVPEDDPWRSVAAACAARGAADLVERAQLLGLPVALVPSPREAALDEQSRQRGRRFPFDPWLVQSRAGGAALAAETAPAVPATPVGAAARPAGWARVPRRVVDLSAMWAGPLCANLLGLAGFEVVKVESTRRPDGARKGPPAFFDLLHGGHLSVALDFTEEADRARLLDLMCAADIVIESSRPRALDQLGLGPEAVLSRSPDTVWVSITGYGRIGPWANRVAFGDDAAAAAGLVAVDETGRTCFCADAVADPLTGLHAALAALAMWHAGAGGLVDVALREVAGSVWWVRPEGEEPSSARRGADGAWVLDTEDGEIAVAQPAARAVTARAAELGADNAAVLGKSATGS